MRHAINLISLVNDLRVKGGDDELCWIARVVCLLGQHLRHCCAILQPLPVSGKRHAHTEGNMLLDKFQNFQNHGFTCWISFTSISTLVACHAICALA